MLLTDRNFNTSFYDPALRHSSVNLLIIFISDIFYHSNILFETMSGLFGGANSNELSFLGPMNSVAIEIVLISNAFLKSISYIRLAKAKIHFKTDSSYEATDLQTVWTYQKNLNDTKVIAFYCGGRLGRILVIMPEQNQSYVRSLILILYQIRDKVNMHSGNPVKYLSTLESLSGELCLFSCSVSSPFSFKSLGQDFKSLNGGKIVDQAKVFGNSKNMLNSIWLNNANQCPVSIHRRQFSTDLTDRNSLSLTDQWINTQ
jgi:hypothetical protein